MVLEGYLMRVLVPEDKCIGGNTMRGRRVTLVTIVLAMIVLVVTIKAT